MKNKKVNVSLIIKGFITMLLGFFGGRMTAPAATESEPATEIVTGDCPAPQRPAFLSGDTTYTGFEK